MNTFEERIKTAKLTKSNRLIAEYCLNNPSSVAFQSAAELAACIGVSDVSIIRFARALGYEGFTDLKRAWQEELSQHIAANPSTVNPVPKFLSRKYYHQEHANFNFIYATETYCQLLHDSLSAISPDLIASVAERLCQSRRKYVVGIRTRCTAATAMTMLLRMVLPDVTPIVGEDYLSYLQMLDFTSDDCVVFITFGRFSNFEQTLLQQVKDHGSSLIVITDKRTSKAAQSADILLYCAGDINLPFYSSVGTVALAECIANAVSEQNWEQGEARIAQSEKYLNKNNPKR